MVERKSVNEILRDTTDKFGNMEISSIDRSRRNAMNSIFGEQLIGNRLPQFNSMFIYPLDSWRLETIVENGGTVGQSNGMLSISTGTNIAGRALASSKRGLRYEPGHEAYALITALFTLGLTDGVKQHIGLFDDVNGYSFGMNNEVFSIFHRRDNSELSVIPQSEFNMDKLDGTGKSRFILDPSKGNIYKISFGYLGFASITFEILAGSEIGWIPFHIIDYANKFTEPHVTLPYLKIRGEVINSGSTSDAIMKASSLEVGTVGSDYTTISARDNSVKFSGSLLASEETPIAIFHNKDTFGGISNRIETLLKIISSAVEGNKPVNISRYKLKIAPTGGTWTDINTAESIMEYSTDATIDLTGAKLTFSFDMDKIGSFFQVIPHEVEYRMLPGEYVVYTTSSDAVGDYRLSVSWDELF